MKRFWLVLATFLALAVQAVPASADLVYTLSVDSDFSTGHNFGTVTLHQDAGNTTTVQVTVQLNTSIAGIAFSNTGAGFATAWDLTAGIVPDTISIVSGAGGTPDAASFSPATTSGNYLGAYKASPFTQGSNGNAFNYAISYGGHTPPPAPFDTLLVFDVTRAAGLALSNFIGNSKYFFAADIITTAGGTRNVAAVGTPLTRAPEPQTWALLIAGLFGLAMLQRRRRRLGQSV